jgi:hypothetical protein
VSELRPNEDGANGIRTRDLHAASVALSQLSYGPASSRVAKMLLLLTGAMIGAVLLVYMALGVTDAD